MARDPRDESLGERLRGTPDDIARGVRGDDDEARGARTEGRMTRDRDIDDDRTRTVQLREEELRARTERVEAGEVEVRTEVVEEEKTLDVPVMHEEVTVERHAVDRRPADRPIGEGETISVPVMEERVTFEKRPVVYEEVSIGKREVQETERHSETVRREVAELDRNGDVNVRGWDEASAGYRQRFESREPRDTRSWEDVEPNYRWGHSAANDPAYAGRSWEEAEPQLRTQYRESARRQGYEAGDDAWEGLRQDAREAWNEVRGRR